LLIGVGILCVVIGFISIFFLQVTHGQINLAGQPTTELMFLEKGRKYSIWATGSNYPVGASTGDLTLFTSDGIPALESVRIQFSFDGEATSQEVWVIDFDVPTSGNYYLQYDEDYSSLYSPGVNLVVRESIIGSLIGIDSFDLLILGVPLIFGGAFLPSVIDWVNHRSKGREPEEDVELESVEPSFEIMPGYDDEQVSCPTCGFMDDGYFCSNCGSRLREEE
ncbi:MAG: hypothetical protein JSV04_11640, partial [Candidatus Heimdallarchaeota archaeon]